jgi:hypothetical protein
MDAGGIFAYFYEYVENTVRYIDNQYLKDIHFGY